MKSKLPDRVTISSPNRYRVLSWLVLAVTIAACAPLKPASGQSAVTQTAPTSQVTLNQPESVFLPAVNQAGLTPQPASGDADATGLSHPDFSQKCSVTLPNGSPPPNEKLTPDTLGNGKIWTGLWPSGVVIADADYVHEDGKIVMKWFWWRAERGAELTIEGRRLDGEAPALEAEIPAGYDSYFQVSGLIFPTEGCWQVTGRVGKDSLSFVTLVVRVPAGVSMDCPVTIPNGSTPPGQSPADGYHGNGEIWATLPVNGVLVAGPEYEQPDGSIEWKAPWFRLKGQLEISGRRLDNLDTPPFEARLPVGYGDSGPQSVSWHFPTEGCWEITGKTGSSRLTFVELVLKSAPAP